MGTYTSKYTGAEIDESVGKMKTLNVPNIVTLSQAEYDALVSAGTVDENTYYFIKEE